MTNSIVHLSALVRDWHASPEAAEPLPVRRGPRGHVNLTGSPEAPAITFTPQHPQFRESLEEGVRDLVLTLVQHMDCITYSSCEGHLAEGDEAIFSHRHVAMICRTPVEQDALLTRLREAIAGVRCASGLVKPRALVEDLVTDTTTIPGICLDFLPLTSDPADYFRELNAVYQQLIHQIESCR